MVEAPGIEPQYGRIGIGATSLRKLTKWLQNRAFVEQRELTGADSSRPERTRLWPHGGPKIGAGLLSLVLSLSDAAARRTPSPSVRRCPRPMPYPLHEPAFSTLLSA